MVQKITSKKACMRCVTELLF